MRGTAPFYNLPIMKSPRSRSIARLAALAILAGAMPRAAAEPPAQDPAELAAAAESYLRQQLAALPGEPSITLDPLRSDRLDACEALTPFMPSGMRVRARMTVGLRCVAPRTWTVYAQATVSVPGQYYVAARQIAPGKTIEAADLTTRDGDLVALPPGVITDAAAILGMRPAHRIAAGQPIKGAGLRSAESVSRGQSVRITARGNGFVVSSEGQALDNAPPGATVQVRAASGQVVSGIVQAAGLVEIQL